MNKREAAKLCRAAAKLIEVEGFCKGSFGPIVDAGPHCIVGALRKEFLRPRNFPTEAVAVAAAEVAAVVAAVAVGAVAEEDCWLGVNLYAWNDAPERTAKDVTHRLREQAFRLEHGGKTPAEYWAERKARSTAIAGNVPGHKL